ncbi:MAG: sigma-70 family RNA polymerase sigma factor [Maribacter sp.]
MGITKRPTEQELILGFRKNDTVVLEAVYTRIFPKIKVHILKNNGNEEQAKDIFQEAFIACWKNIKANKLSENGNVEAYLYTIAKNKWTDYLRSSDYKKTVFHDDKLPIVMENDDLKNDEIKREANAKVLQLALSQLGQNCKSLLNLFYFERKSMDEISQLMNLASASARNQKYRCMEKLRKLSLEIKKNG